MNRVTRVHETADIFFPKLIIITIYTACSDYYENNFEQTKNDILYSNLFCGFSGKQTYF